MDRKILSIDPGNQYSAYTVLDKDLKPLKIGKIKNEELVKLLPKLTYDCHHVAIEMIASYGMAVGATVFETCVWIGRFEQICRDRNVVPVKIFRKDVKMNLCYTIKAKDSNITQALVDRFSYERHKSKGGKGVKADPGWFYGFKSDIWAAYAVGVTYSDKVLKENIF